MRLFSLVACLGGRQQRLTPTPVKELMKNIHFLHSLRILSVSIFFCVGLLLAGGLQPEQGWDKEGKEAKEGEEGAEAAPAGGAKEDAKKEAPKK